MIEFQNVTFSYEGYAEEENANSVSNIDLQIKEGQTVLLTGPSGCGKSTLLRLLNGLCPHFYEGRLDGSVLVDGKSPADVPLYEMAELLGSVFQNPRSQFYNVDTNGELAFACENQGMEKDEILQRMERSVIRFQIEDLLNRNVFHLSGGQKQQLACASVDVSGPDIFLLDEPSANLDYEATQRLSEVIRTWQKAGKTILIAEHRIAWLWDLCDRVIVMDQGKIRHDFIGTEKQQVTPEQCRNLGLRSFAAKDPQTIRKTCEPSEPDLVFESLRFAYEKGKPVLDLANLRFAAGAGAGTEGKVNAVVGTNGAGKTTLLHCMAGLKKKARGTVRFQGSEYSLKAFGKKVFLVMQDVNHQLFTESVLEEVSISMQREDDETIKEILQALDLWELRERHPMSLSGGQKQRVAIACAVASECEVLLFDEPTSGLDLRHMEQTAELLQRLAQMGKTVIVVTHDSELIEACCEHVVTLGKER